MLICVGTVQVSGAEVKDYSTLKEANETPGDRIYNVSNTTEPLEAY